MKSVLQERLLQANHIVVFTGAGMSAESGIATFRDPGGLWQRFSPQELASMDGFLANPQRVLEWYDYRRKVIHEAEPNAGHLAIARLEELCAQTEKNFTLITQNVDRLHQRAGSVNVLEVHGNLEENRCSVGLNDCADAIQDASTNCVKCGALMRPNVVWFGEDLPIYTFEQAELASQEADVFISVGTSAEVYPAAGLPLVARQSGSYLVEVNPSETAQSDYYNETIRSTSASALPSIANLLGT